MKKGYSKRDYSRAILARKIQRAIGRPNTQKIMKIVTNNQLPNCPISTKDIVAAEAIFGLDIGMLEGKTRRKKTILVSIIKPIPIPERYKDITLAIDIMYINAIPFLTTISRNIKFGSAQAIPDRTHKSIYNALRKKSRYIHILVFASHIY